MDILKEHTLLTKVKVSKESQLETITATDDKEIQTKIKLRKEIFELKVDIKAKMDEYWSLWTQLLDGSLKERWDEIVSKHTDDEKGCVAADGVRMTGRRGKTIPAMKACIRQWLLQVMEPNAAERHRNYLSAQIRMPLQGNNCKAFAGRVLQLNEYCYYLPCLKDKEGSPLNLKRCECSF